MTKALFFDIDGTLVSFQTHVVPQSAVDALAEAHSRGVQVFISTGRPRMIINNLHPLQERGLIDGYITMNGAYCFTGDTVISKQPISRPSVRAVLDYTYPRGIPCIVVGEHDICATHAGDAYLQDLFYRQLACPVRFQDVTPDEAMQRGEVFQLTPFTTEEQQRELAPQIADTEGGRWHPAFVDITAQGCTKQKGIDDICRHFGIRLEDTMAFGDGGNDIPMIRHAQVGVAMGNARRQVKDVADYVTDTVDNDGVLKALKHFGVI